MSRATTKNKAPFLSRPIRQPPLHMLASRCRATSKGLMSRPSARRACRTHFHVPTRWAHRSPRRRCARHPAHFLRPVSPLWPERLPKTPAAGHSIDIFGPLSTEGSATGESPRTGPGDNAAEKCGTESRRDLDTRYNVARFESKTGSACTRGKRDRSTLKHKYDSRGKRKSHAMDIE